VQVPLYCPYHSRKTAAVISLILPPPEITLRHRHRVSAEMYRGLLYYAHDDTVARCYIFILLSLLLFARISLRRRCGRASEIIILCLRVKKRKMKNDMGCGHLKNTEIHTHVVTHDLIHRRRVPYIYDIYTLLIILLLRYT